MHSLSAKKILLIIFALALLIVIPVVLYLVSQQKPKTEAASTTLTFVPATQSVNKDESVGVDISMDPGKNSVAIVKLLIAYDATKLATTEGGFSPNSTSFPSVVSGPIYGDGTIDVTLSVGANSPPIQTTTKVASITFKALETTDTAPTQLTFNTQTQVLSASGTNQDVLSSAAPATVNIAAAQETPTPFPTTSEPLIPTPTTSSGLSVNTTTTQQTGPVCISFTADRPTTGTAPFNVNFTLIATDAAAVIEKATFDFGDGQKRNVTSPEIGVSPHDVNTLSSHVYENNGTFTATGSITDVDGNVSDTGTCSITVNLSSEIAQTSTTGGELTPIPSPLPPTGSNSFVGILTFGVVLTLIGAFILFSL